ncbi:multidrug efflux SMR transporter [Paenibacillus sp. GD4]|jgi:paired small multidrug resistance pump|uniref:DMT family transporter n=1 Tax=Paenibacillus sp. GD4 TaxID=3068890 RepID=UPI002796CE37|nr:multidrug efflux SMR transporter [Paenibacillus sp. GD4]MDQ1910807.1 multidrug efflux SMR transporter [Paenibacillus sp. GD4]
MNKGWVFVFIGSVIEVLWVTGLKHSHHYLEWTGTVLAIALSFYLLIRSIGSGLPVGTVYAVFTGLGTMGTVLTEMIVFGEPFRVLKIVLIVVLVAGVMGLKLVTSNPEPKGGAV